MLPSTAPRGMFEAVVAGYHLAWTQRRRLLTVQFPILAVLLTGTVLLDLVPGRDSTAVIDHVLVLTGEPGLVTLVHGLLTGLCALLALIAGALALTAEENPVRAAGRKLLVVVFGLLLVGGAAVALFWLLRNLAGVALFLAVAGLGSARLVLESVVPHPTWRATASVLIGALGLTLPFGYVLGLFTVVPLLTAPAGTLLLIIVLAGLAGVLAVHAAAPEAVEAPKKRGLWLAAGAVVASLVLGGGAAFANPRGAPVVRTHEGFSGGAEAIAWPAGQHPVIVTGAGVRFCDTDLCDRFTGQTGGPAVGDGAGRVLGPVQRPGSNR